MSLAKKVLIVEDDPDMAGLLGGSLLRNGYDATYCSSGSGVKQIYESSAISAFDYVLLDLGLPDIDGFKILGFLREKHRGPILVVSALSDEDQKVKALDAGADDYLVKPAGINELLARMRVLSRHFEGGHTLENSFIFNDLHIDLNERTIKRGSEVFHITPTEHKILSILLLARGRIITHRRLLSQVWGPDAADQVHYLRIYMAKLRQKIEPIPAEPKTLLTETGVGYRLVMPTSTD